jgi:hypothetical protein
VEQANKLDEAFPYWSERKLSLFIPVSMEVDPEDYANVQ